MICVNAMGDTCPVPVIKTRNAIKELQGGGVVQTLVDNEIAVQNLSKMAGQMGYRVTSEQISDNEYKVTMQVGEVPIEEKEKEILLCEPCGEAKKTVVVISSAVMGAGNDELGATLMKGFIYALSQQEELPDTILFYNGGASIPCEGSVSVEDLRVMEAQGVEILTCGTCLNFYGLTEKLQVGGVTNMYSIAEKMTQADRIVKP